MSHQPKDYLDGETIRAKGIDWFCEVIHRAKALYQVTDIDSEGWEQFLEKAYNLYMQEQPQMVNLRLSVYSLEIHAQQWMRERGITYALAVPQSMGDQWWFFDCQNVPENIKRPLSLLHGPVEDFIGHGLSREDCLMLRKQFYNRIIKG